MKHLIIGTAGHIDHGKTSLIKMLTGIDCDTHKEEKTRGITINLGFSHLELPNGESAGIIDVPGHKDFINTMVGGACGIDMVLLVIAADSGIMPQTEEHVNIITALGIKKGVVALTKSDLVDEELLEMARYEISDYLDKTTLKDITIIPVSAHTGNGKEELIHAISTTIAEISEKEQQNLFRMYIDRIFTVKGFGSVVTGSVLGGAVNVGDEVFLLPDNSQKLRVRSIERHGKAVERVVAGDRAAINLIGLKAEDFERGMLICSKNIENTSMCDATIKLFKNAPSLPLWSTVTLISGTFETTARMHLLNTDTLEPGESAIVQIHLNKPGVLLVKDKFIIRNSSADTTLGGGYIFDAAPLHHKRRTPALVQALKEVSENIINSGSAYEQIRSELKREFRPFALTEVSEKLHISAEEIKECLSEDKSGIVYFTGENTSILTESAYNEQFKSKIIKYLQEFHAKNPLFPHGMDINEITGKFSFAKLKHARTYVMCLLKELQTEKSVSAFKETWIIAGHEAKADKQTEEHIKTIEQLIKRYQGEKPAITEIEAEAAKSKILPAKIKIYLNILAQEGKIQFSQNDFIHTDELNKHRLPLLKMLSSHENGVELPVYKDFIGGTKSYRALLTDIFEAEKILTVKRISDSETRFCITDTGKKMI